MGGSQVSLSQLEVWVSQARLAKYRDATDPVALYVWNAELGAAVFELIGHVEVLLRNAITATLVPKSGTLPWYDDPFYRFNHQTLQDITKAKARAGGGGRIVTPDRVVSELTFGFWRYMLSATYQATVWPSANRAFQGLRRSQRNRASLEAQVLAIADTRNRIAHQEPIFTVPQTRMEADIIELAGHIDPLAAKWIQSISRVSAALALKPS